MIGVAAVEVEVGEEVRLADDAADRVAERGVGQPGTYTRIAAVVLEAFGCQHAQVAGRREVDVPHHAIRGAAEGGDRLVDATKKIRTVRLPSGVEDRVHETEAVDVVVDVVEEERVQDLP